MENWSSKTWQYIAPATLLSCTGTTINVFLAYCLLQVNADIRQAQSQSGVGMFALRDLKQGDTIMAVPVDRGFSALSQYGVLVIAHTNT
jgi:hypothetical protein